jgi:hypothetical protein
MLSTPVLARRRSAALLFVGAVTALAAAAIPATGAAAPKTKEPPIQAPPRPYSFLLNYTDQLGVPGFAGGTGVTPQSDLYTGYDELSLRVGPGERSFPSDGRTLAQDRYPVLISDRLDGRILYRLTVFAAPVSGQQVNFARVDAFNPGTKPRAARVTGFTRSAGAALVTHPNGRTYRSYRFGRPSNPERPGLYFQPGADLNPLSVYSFAGEAFTRDGAVLYDAHPVEPGVRVTQSLRVDALPIDRQTIFGQSDYNAVVKPGKHVHVDFRMPVTPLPPATPQYGRVAHASFNAYLRKTLGFWGQLQRGAMRIALPEPKVVNTFYASLSNILLPRYRAGTGDWVQTVNQQRYHAFWLRDGAMINHALDVAGLHRQAGQNLPFFLTWQDPSGLFISRPGQLDGFGEALWALGDHLERTGDTAFARRAYPAVQHALAWFEAARAADPLHLLPVATPGDNEVTTGHLPGNDFWAYAGVEQAVRMARRLGQGSDASRWNSDLADYRQTIQAQVRASSAKLGGFIPPALEGGGQDWGNYWAAYPSQPFAPTDPLVTRTIQHARSEYREGIASYGEPKMLHAYLGFRVLETQLERNEPSDVVQGFYSELAHTTSTGASFETGLLPFADRTIDLATVPHGWWAAEYVTLLRNMLLREEGNGVVLMSALSPSWLKPGQVVGVREAPTTFGTVAFTLATRADGATLSWRTNLRSGTKLSWPVPVGVTAVHAPGLSRGVIHLRGRSGSIQVSWKIARGPKPTFEKTVAALLKQYKRFGGAARGAGHNAAPVVSG